MEVSMGRTKEFFIHMDLPTVTFQDKKLTVNKKTGKPIIYDSYDLKKLKANFRCSLIDHLPDEKFKGPVMVVTKWCYGIKGNHKDGEWKITKPDVDNLNKALLDAMTGVGFWKDDSRVTRLISEKFWAKVPGVYVYVSELER